MVMCNGSHLTNRKNNLHYFVVYLPERYSLFMEYEEVTSEKGCVPTIREAWFSQRLRLPRLQGNAVCVRSITKLSYSLVSHSLRLKIAINAKPSTSPYSTHMPRQAILSSPSSQ